MNVRSADPSEVDHLARIWHDGWHEAHAALLPTDLTRVRTLDSFRERLLSHLLPTTRVVGPPGAPTGFSITKDDELYQLFVSPEARGGGAAAALISDAEAQLAATGVQTAWLACAIGNARAARFYEKSGWHRAGTVAYEAETPSGTLRIEVWRYEKPLMR